MLGSTMTTLGVVALYFATSATLTVINKLILTKYEFPGNISLMALQQTFLVTFLTFQRFFSPPSRAKIAKGTGGLTFVIFAHFAYVYSSLVGLKYTSLPVFTTLRKLGVLMVIVLEVFQGRSFAWQDCYPLSVIVFAASVSAVYDTEFHALGYVMCFLCNVFTAIYLTYSKKIQDGDDGLSPKVLLYSLGVYSLPIYVVLGVATNEWRALHEYDKWNEVFPYLVFSSVIASVMNYAVFFNIKLTSATAQSVCANAKDAIVILYGTLFIGQQVSVFTLSGALATVFAAGLYSIPSTASDSTTQVTSNLLRKGGSLLVVLVILVAISG